jgi:Cu(I)/Ag(I) efflux system periplasmic protein CusF
MEACLLEGGWWVERGCFNADWRAIVGKRRQGTTRGAVRGTLRANRCYRSGQEFSMNRRHSLVQIAGLAIMPLWAQAQTPSSLGEVLKVDRTTERITLKHNGVKNLDLPAMTLVFHVRNPQWLDGLSSGDRVRFSAERIDGQTTITALSRVP